MVGVKGGGVWGSFLGCNPEDESLTYEMIQLLSQLYEAWGGCGLAGEPAT